MTRATATLKAWEAVEYAAVPETPETRGNVYFSDGSSVLMTQSSFPEQLVATGRIERPGLEAGTLRIETPDGTPTRMSESLSDQASGSQAEPYPDYRGVPVVGAWTWYGPLDVGIAVEQDAAEAYGLYDEREHQGLIVAFGGAAILSSVNFFLYGV